MKQIIYPAIVGGRASESIWLAGSVNLPGLVRSTARVAALERNMGTTISSALQGCSGSPRRWAKILRPSSALPTPQEGKGDRPLNALPFAEWFLGIASLSRSVRVLGRGSGHTST